MNKKSLSKAIGVPLFILLLIGFMFYGKYWDRKFQTENINFFIGTIMEYDPGGAKGAPWYEYKYFAYGKKYSGRKDITKELPKPLKSYIGKRFFVKVLPDHPKVSRLMLDKPVPSHIKEAPTNGWEKIPQ